MDGGGGVDAVDLRRSMAAQRLAFERQIADGRERTKASTSAFSASLLSARSLANHTISHREKLKELKDRLRKLEADLAEALSRILPSSSFCLDTSHNRFITTFFVN
ncbi:hypothetical protein GUJ93_ZPchr0001g32576 [Zizania palustris]|uniref:Uncharacterized protein n=1 Tax=Zizania palustris TaxID=103762 RepID=A0A8J5RP50_ZIZPA|nr:hypothetical protein GUJ93_ZPchr0001g32576 [Zizania palustris]